MIEKILGILLAFFQAIPIVRKWLNVPPTKQIEDARKELDEEQRDYEKAGRPPK